MNKQIINKLVKLANHLDKKGLTREANLLDSVIKKLAVPMEPGVDETIKDQDNLQAGIDAVKKLHNDALALLTPVIENGPMNWKRSTDHSSEKLVYWDNDDPSKQSGISLEKDRKNIHISIGNRNGSSVIFRSDAEASPEDQLKDLQQSLPSISRVVGDRKIFNSIGL